MLRQKRLVFSLQNEIRSKEELRSELWQNIELRKKSEDDLTELASEVNSYKLQFENRRSQDVQDMQQLQTLVTDLRLQNEDLHKKLLSKADESKQLNEETMHWKERGDRLQDEVSEMKRMIEEVELKNRRLVEKLNE